jgi:ABC-type taurine transport system ATPase subunit
MLDLRWWMNKRQRRNMVRERLKWVKLAGLEKKISVSVVGRTAAKVDAQERWQLSGGFALDEPFSALDDH